MEIDHIIPEALGGSTEEHNLWLACALCNHHKAGRIAALDVETGEMVRLFNPRYEAWEEHFTPKLDNRRWTRRSLPPMAP